MWGGFCIAIFLSTFWSYVLTTQTLILIFFICLSPISWAQEKNEDLSIIGWPLQELNREQPPSWLGDDPVLGRQICPPFTRLNLAKGISDSVVFSSVAEEATTQKWIYTIREGLFWWDGSPVTSEDVALYLKNNFRDQVASKYANLWVIPAHTIDFSKNTVTITWQEPPPFGPFINSGLAFWRKARAEDAKKGGFAYQCIGLFIPKATEDGFLLQANQAYPLFKQHTMTMSLEPQIKEKNKILPTNKRVISFDFANSLSVIPKERLPQKPVPCRNLIDTPLLSLIAWNHQRDMVKTPELRKKLASLIPREPLRQSGAGFWGESVSSIFSKNHPGYDSSLVLQPFQLKRMSHFFPLPKGAKKSQPTLTLGSIRKDPGIVEKVLVDILKTSGFNVEFIDSKEAVDGFMTGFFMPWPQLDYLAFLHSHAKETANFFPIKDNALDEALEKYSRTLTLAKPNLSLLKQVHKRLFEIELFSVLLHHDACLKNSTQTSPQNIDTKDPDWFRKIVFAGILSD